MARKLFGALAVAGLAAVLFPLAFEVEPFRELSPPAADYAERTDDEVGAANLVTAVIVTYRGLDTLGEVTVLFIATAGVGFLLRRAEAHEPGASRPTADSEDEIEGPSEILETGGRLLIPVIVTFGVFIFLHGHLSPGGGFQGGVILASAVLLFFLSRKPAETNHTLLTVVESLSGGFYIVLGILGLVLGAGFLDNRILPLGEFGSLFSAGAIPVIYSLVGLKVGAELSGILAALRGRDGGHT
ncbi:MAG: sodium:proton antiporter [Spirochaetes bacterium]|jgi:multicomponent Na+:H+ antiporter subunit B|nr:sodium:proton antiporter [Spirochaetota bacterium]